MLKVSFVIPCYRSEHTIEMVVREITDTMEKLMGFHMKLFL